MAAIDKFFFNIVFDQKYPLSSVMAKARVGSDHVPLILNCCIHEQKKPRLFKLDFSFQETKKETFEDSFLNYVNRDFIWNFLPAQGTARGILVGLNSNKFEVLAWQQTRYFVSVMIKNCSEKFVWRFISVYGSAYEEGKADFIQELSSLLENWDGPTLVGVILI